MAIKVINEYQQSFSSLQELLPEVNSMKVLNHPNIVKLPKVTDTEEKLASLRITSVGETGTPTWMSRAT